METTQTTATRKPVPTIAFKGQLEVCTVCERVHSSTWFRGERYGMLVCRICTGVYQDRYGDAAVSIAVEGGRPVLR